MTRYRAFCIDRILPAQDGRIFGKYARRRDALIDKRYLGIGDPAPGVETQHQAVGQPRDGTPGAVSGHAGYETLLGVVERVEPIEGPVAQAAGVDASDLFGRGAVIALQNLVEHARFDLGVLAERPFGLVETPLAAASGQSRDRIKKGIRCRLFINARVSYLSDGGVRQYLNAR